MNQCMFVSLIIFTLIKSQVFGASKKLIEMKVIKKTPVAETAYSSFDDVASDEKLATLKSYCSNKTRINLFDKHLTDKGLGILLSVFPVDLKDLGLNCSDLTSPSIKLVLARCINLRMLGLKNYTHPDDSIVDALVFLVNNYNLIRLVISNNHFTREQLESLVTRTKNFSIRFYKDSLTRSNESMIKELCKKYPTLISITDVKKSKSSCIKNSCIIS